MLGGANAVRLNLCDMCIIGVSGWMEPRLIEEVIHNRTVNLKGGLGHNIAMDRVCEFLNAEFKGKPKHHRK